MLQISELYCIIKKTLTLEKPDHHLYLLRYKDLTKSMYHVNASNLLISIILPHLIRHSSKNPANLFIAYAKPRRRIAEEGLRSLQVGPRRTVLLPPLELATVVAAGLREEGLAGV